MDYKNLISTISQGLAAFDAVYDRLACQNGLTYNALMVIYILFKQESVTQKALCEELFLSKSTVHSIVKGFIVDDILTFSEQRYGKEKELIFTINGKKYAKKSWILFKKRKCVFYNISVKKIAKNLVR